MRTSLEDVCTFVIPVRIDSKERMRNLHMAVDWLSPLGAQIHILEADKEQQICPKDFTQPCVNIHYIKDEEPIFHRTHYINRLLQMSTTPFVAVWDTDIIIDHKQILYAVYHCLVEEGCTLAYPYNNKFVSLDEKLSKKFVSDGDIGYLNRRKLRSIIDRPFCGGAYIVDKQKYNSIGGENEFFVGWGPEDAERLRRTQIMEHKVGWASDGCAYHLYHPRNENSRFFNEETAVSTRREFIKVCSMNKEELSEYIKTMPR